MVLINTLEVSPPLINASCAWACEYAQLRDLYDCPYLGAVTTRTATLHGWTEDETKTVVFDITTGSTLNNYGYSPHPLGEYLQWVYRLLTEPTATGAPPSRPVLISLTAANPTILEEMLVEVQDLRARLRTTPRTPGAPDPSTLIGVEFNTSCPNIKDTVPLAYNFPLLTPLLDTLSSAFFADPSLTIGLKLPPYLYDTRFREVVRSLATYSRMRPGVGGLMAAVNPFAYLECTNTLGNALFFADHAVPAPPPERAAVQPYALASPLGGLGGEAIHTLALGNVYSFASLLKAHPDPAVQRIVVIGAGGITSQEAASRMQRAGAKILACATLLGREGVSGFQRLFEAVSTT